VKRGTVGNETEDRERKGTEKRRVKMAKKHKNTELIKLNQ